MRDPRLLKISLAVLSTGLDLYTIMSGISAMESHYSGAVGLVNLENVRFLKGSDRHFKVRKLLYEKKTKFGRVRRQQTVISDSLLGKM